MSRHAPVIISGGGIAGLAAAIALARSGFEVRIFEKVPMLTEQGAGIQLGPNATAILRHWGLEQDLAKRACQPEMIELYDGVRGKLLSSLPVGRFSRGYWPAPYVTIHRGDLQKILKQAVEANRRISLHCGHEITSLADLDEIEPYCGALRLACDGVWSNLRAECLGSDGPQFSNFIAWRATVDLSQAPNLFRSQNVRVFMGASGHFIAYPISGGGKCNLVAITPSQSADNGDRSDLVRAFKGWKAGIEDIIAAVSDWTYWPLFTRTKPYFLSPNGIVFLGDSAHATTPFAAQGAGMALEDAAELAKYLPSPAALTRQNLAAFAHARTQRVNKIIKRGAFNRFVYHSKGAVALMRNQFMIRRAGEKFLTDLDWLYCYKSF